MAERVFDLLVVIAENVVDQTGFGNQVGSANIVRKQKLAADQLVHGVHAHPAQHGAGLVDRDQIGEGRVFFDIVAAVFHTQNLHMILTMAGGVQYKN